MDTAAHKVHSKSNSKWRHKILNGEVVPVNQLRGRGKVWQVEYNAISATPNKLACSKNSWVGLNIFCLQIELNLTVKLNKAIATESNVTAKNPFYAHILLQFLTLCLYSEWIYASACLKLNYRDTYSGNFLYSHLPTEWEKKRATILEQVYTQFLCFTCPVTCWTKIFIVRMSYKVSDIRFKVWRKMQL